MDEDVVTEGAAEPALGDASEQVRDAVESAQQSAARIGTYIDETVRDRPLTALLAAGAVGYVLALLIHRR